jgi:hypothetical protein
MLEGVTIAGKAGIIGQGSRCQLIVVDKEKVLTPREPGSLSVKARSISAGENDTFFRILKSPYAALDASSIR